MPTDSVVVLCVRLQKGKIELKVCQAVEEQGVERATRTVFVRRISEHAFADAEERDLYQQEFKTFFAEWGVIFDPNRDRTFVVDEGELTVTEKRLAELQEGW